jgi:hypothetical protein
MNPPAATGTTRRIGLLGNGWPCAAQDASNSTPMASRPVRPTAVIGERGPCGRLAALHDTVALAQAGGNASIAPRSSQQACA